mgnify:CR=1 FL=1
MSEKELKKSTKVVVVEKDSNTFCFLPNKFVNKLCYETNLSKFSNNKSYAGGAINIAPPRWSPSPPPNHQYTRQEIIKTNIYQKNKILQKFIINGKNNKKLSKISSTIKKTKQEIDNN